jgi:hypothetical protein
LVYRIRLSAAILSGVWHAHIWIYFLGEFGGAVAAALLSRIFVKLDGPARPKTEARSMTQVRGYGDDDMLVA